MAVADGVVTKLLYVVVVEDGGALVENEVSSLSSTFRYTRSVLQSALQLMGCKPRHAFKISQRVFEIMERGKSLAACEGIHQKDVKVSHDRQSEHNDNTCLKKGIHQKDVKVSHGRQSEYNDNTCLKKSDVNNLSIVEDVTRSKPFELYKRRTTVVVRRNYFLYVVCEALSEYKYVGPNQRADLVLACRVKERKESVTVLLCGTSGCGKSTLSALLGSRLGITTVVSTDSIRHMMRSFVDEKQNPLLWSSTYHAGEYLDPVAVAKAKSKKKANKPPSLSVSPAKDSAVSNSTIDLISLKQMAIEGFKAQSEMVIDSLDRLITAWEKRKESVVVEGVHLSLNFVMGLMKKHPSIIPFMIYISNEEKHLERFAVRAKYMTLDPAKNKYVKYIRNIRTIQEYLCKRADKHLVPKINNTNVDKSVAAIHATVFSCLRRREAGEPLYDPITNTVTVIDEEYRNQCAANSLSSKGMFQLIQRKGSTKHLMALLNTDGSVAKAWPLDMVDDNGKPILGHPSGNGIGTPMYGPLQIDKAEPVNLHFGHFGISAWPGDIGCTSHASSVDESRGQLTDNGSKHVSSCCSSPRISGWDKELMEEMSFNGSDEEVDESLEVDSDEDLSDGEKRILEELEGSVDEGSTKSDEEYDDLAMLELDIPDNGYITDYDEEFNYKINLNDCAPTVPGEQANKNVIAEKYKQNLDIFQRTKNEPLSESVVRAVEYPIGNKNERRARLRKRSLSIPASGKHGSQMNVPTGKEALLS